MAASGNSTFTTANGAAYAIEKTIKRDFKLLWDTAHPLLALIQNGGNFNKGGKIEGLSLVLPVQFDNMTTPVDGSAASNLTPLTPGANQGDTQALFAFTRYHGAFWLDPDELQLLMNGARGNLLQARKKQVTQSYKKALSGDLQGTAAAARANVMGLRHTLSQSNTVGGITQGGDNGYWNAQLRTAGGVFAASHVDDMMDAIHREGRSKVDLINFGSNSTVNMIGKMRDNVAPLQRIQNSNSKLVKFGFDSFVYRDAECVDDPDLGSALSTTGAFQCLSTDSFYWMGDPDKMKVTQRGLEGTGAQEFYHESWVCLACDDIAVNGFASAYTS